MSSARSTYGGWKWGIVLHFGRNCSKPRSTLYNHIQMRIVDWKSFYYTVSAFNVLWKQRRKVTFDFVGKIQRFQSAIACCRVPAKTGGSIVLDFSRWFWISNWVYAVPGKHSWTYYKIMVLLLIFLSSKN
jgi:hypothetical protein